MEKLEMGRHTFELVDSVPAGYVIWNIGKNMVDGYLPIVQVGEGCRVNDRTMKAIKVDGAQTVLAAVGYGPGTVKEMEKYIRKHGKSRPSEVERMKKALPIMRQIKGL
jgi:hypothetical protein